MYTEGIIYEGMMSVLAGYGYSPFKVAMHIWKSDRSIVQKCLCSLALPVSPIAWFAGHWYNIGDLVKFEIKFHKFMKKTDVSAQDLDRIMDYAGTVGVDFTEMNVRCRLRPIAKMGAKIVPQLIEIATRDETKGFSYGSSHRAFFLLSEIGAPASIPLLKIVAGGNSPNSIYAASALKERGYDVLPEIRTMIREGDISGRTRLIKLACDISKNGKARLKHRNIEKLEIESLGLKQSFMRQRRWQAKSALPLQANPGIQNSLQAKKVLIR